jgi:hypothetical protein
VDVDEDDWLLLEGDELEDASEDEELDAFSPWRSTEYKRQKSLPPLLVEFSPIIHTDLAGPLIHIVTNHTYTL